MTRLRANRFHGPATLVIAGVAATTLFGQAATNYPAYPRQDIGVSYRVEDVWPQRPADGEWGAMSSVTLDPQGVIWTFNRGKTPIQAYRSTGALVTKWGDGLFKNPHQIRFDREGNLWAIDNGFNTVTKWTPDGRLLLTLGVKDEQGDDEKHFNQPTDIAFAQNGDLLIADGYVNSRIVQFDKTGKFKKAWGKLGTAPGEFSVPHGIAIDSKGRIYVTDRNNGRVQIFDRDGKYVTEWRNVIQPWAIWITPADEIYICGSTPSAWWENPKGTFNGTPPKDQIVVRFDTDGRVKNLWSFPSGTSKIGELGWIHSLAVDAKGNLYTGGVRDNKAQKFVRVDSSHAGTAGSRDR
jgi:streptogramin lyase